MKLSIIIPTYNSAKVLQRTLDSIVGQTFADWEVLVMDSASTDQTVDIAKSYQDERIKVFSEPDDGVYDAMNKGIKIAGGEWLYFLGSDDWLLNKEVLQGFFSLDIEGFEVVYGDVEADQLASEHKGEWTVDTIEYNRCHQAIFYKRSLFAKNGLYDTKYKILADYAFNLKWFLQGKIKSKHIDLIIAHYSKGGLSENCIDELFRQDSAFLFIKYGHKSIPLKKQKEMARQAMVYNTQRPMALLSLKTYVLFLRAKDALRRLCS